MCEFVLITTPRYKALTLRLADNEVIIDKYTSVEVNLFCNVLGIDCKLITMPDDGDDPRKYDRLRVRSNTKFKEII